MNVFLLRTVYAQEPLFADEPVSLFHIVDVIGRVFNVLLLSVGVVFVALILTSAYKFAMSQGDPKGIEGAKKSLTHAVIGFVVVAGAFAIINILLTSIIPNAGFIPDPIDALRVAIGNLSEQLGIEP